MHIFINPGHSLNCNPDPGCAYNGIKEADIAAKIGRELYQFLEQKGIKTTLYQQTGSKLTANQQLNTVATKANVSGADLFLSIHMNGVTNSSAKGTETWYSNGSIKGKKFAECINNELIKPFSNYTLSNRGVKPDSRGLAVLKYTNMPAILTEIGFISNKNEAEFIRLNTHNIALRLYFAICKYYGIDSVINDSPNWSEVKLKRTDEGLYDCYIDGKLKLKSNKFTSCTKWLETNYEV